MARTSLGGTTASSSNSSLGGSTTRDPFARNSSQADLASALCFEACGAAKQGRYGGSGNDIVVRPTPTAAPAAAAAAPPGEVVEQRRPLLPRKRDSGPRPCPRM